MKTTIGQVLINEKLPEPLRDYTRVMDKKTLYNMFTQVAEKYPAQYAEIATDLNKLGYQVAYERGSSVSLKEFEPLPGKEEEFRTVEKSIASLRMQHSADPVKRDQLIAKEYSGLQKSFTDRAMKEGLQNKNRLAQMVHSGARGKKDQFSSTTASAVMYADHRDRPILVPVHNSFAEGYDAAEYWASSYGTRKGQISTKFATQDAGAMAKLFSQANLTQVVVKNDCGTHNGVPSSVTDSDNIGGYLAQPAGMFKYNDKVTAEMLSQLKTAGVGTVVMRSPLTCESAHGICARCRGTIETGRLANIGDNVGLTSAAAMAEPIGQASLNVKHTGGVAGVGGQKSGYEVTKQLISIPKEFPNRAAVAEVDGVVERSVDAPQGGRYTYVSGTQHYSLPGLTVSVKEGQRVEAGDALDNGLLNPARVVHYKGVGEGRKYFAEKMRETLLSSDIDVNKRHVELMSRALINKAQVDRGDIMEGALPDEIVDFQQLQSTYRPRDAKELPVEEAVGKYLAKPVLFYTVGTLVRPSVADALKRNGVPMVQVTDIEPPFRPVMIRIQEVPLTGRDWMTKLYGRGLKKSILEATHRGRTSPDHSTSFVPSLAKGVSFGRSPKGRPEY